MSTPVDPPLAGVRILDLAEGDFQMVGRYLADLGADVLRVEPPGGSSDRAAGVLSDGVSLTFEIANAGKRFTTADPLDELLAGADIVLLDRRSGFVTGGRLDPSELTDSHPGTVVTLLSDFGAQGSRKDWVSTPGVQFALSTILSRSGLPDRGEPLLPPSFLVAGAVAPQAVWLTLAAHLRARRSGVGELVDFATLDALLHIFDPPMGMQGSGRTGIDPFDVPHGRPDARAIYPIFATADGMVRVCVLSPRQWESMRGWLGDPEELRAPELRSPAGRVAAQGMVFAHYRALLAGLSTQEAVRLGEYHRVPVASIDRLADVLDEPAFRASGSITGLTLPDGRVAAVPSGVYTVDGVRTGITATEATEATENTAPGAPAWLHDRLPASGAQQSGAQPLEGVRVLDLGVIVMGAETGRLLADLGADVIKIESSGFPDGCRQMSPGVRMTKSFAWGHRNKRSIGLDLGTAEGKDIFRRLVAGSDVVLSNFKPGILERLGFGHDTLRAINPGIVVSESSAYGTQGPWSTKMGYGPLVRAAAGLTDLWCYPGDAEGFSDTVTIYPDHVVGRLNASGVLALLLRRARTGRGGVVATAQVDAIFAAMAGRLAAESLGTCTQDAPLQDAPCGLFPAAGDDQWVVVDGHGDDRFAALANAVGHPDWVGDDRFATLSGRLTHTELLEDALRRWTSSRTASTAARQLQDAGVPAGHMMRFADIAHDHDFSERGLLTTMVQPQFPEPLPTLAGEGVCARPDEVRPAPAPLQGQHTREVVREVLGLDDARVDDLLARGVLETNKGDIQ